MYFVPFVSGVTFDALLGTIQRTRTGEFGFCASKILLKTAILCNLACTQCNHYLICYSKYNITCFQFEATRQKQNVSPIIVRYSFFKKYSWLHHCQEVSDSSPGVQSIVLHSLSCLQSQQSISCFLLIPSNPVTVLISLLFLLLSCQLLLRHKKMFFVWPIWIAIATKHYRNAGDQPGQTILYR